MDSQLLATLSRRVKKHICIIRDAVTLKRAEILHDRSKKLYRIVTARQKTGTHVSVPIPPDVAAELLGVPNDNPVYLLWNTGTGKEQKVRFF